MLFRKCGDLDWSEVYAMGKDVGEFVLAVLEHLHGWISGGLLALAVELLDRLFDWKIPRKPWIAIFIVGGLFVSVFGAWRDEHEKVITQRPYIEIEFGQPWISPAPAWVPNAREMVNVGRENATSYPANEESALQELIITSAPAPLWNYLGDPDKSPSSPGVETRMWEQMLRDRQKVPHQTGTYDPGEKHFGSAYTTHPLSESELDRILVQATDIVYLVGLDKWKDGSGVHGKSFCYWLQPPRNSVSLNASMVILQQCQTHNDFIEDATEYLKFFTSPS
jgi:hypothetical protein